VKPDHVISAPDVASVYDVPLNFERDRLSDIILAAFKLKSKKPSNLKEWSAFAKKAHNGHKKVKIAVVGKYFDTGDFVLSDAYLSVIEALKYSSLQLGVKPELTWINSRDFEKDPKSVSLPQQVRWHLSPGRLRLAG